MRLCEVNLYKRLLDHSAINEQYELEIMLRGTKEELTKMQKLIIENI